MEKGHRWLSKASRSLFLTNRICQHQPKRFFDLHSQIGPSKEQFEAVKQDLYASLSRENVRLLQKFPLPDVNNPGTKERRSSLFTKEVERQAREVGRIHKITVDFKNEEKWPDSATLVMNRGISTPHHCAMHLGETLRDRSIVAEVNGQLWDVHKPLEDSCTLRLLHMKMKDEDPYHVNRVFWRSCSFMLGAVLETAFRDHIYVELHSFPSPNVRSGSFVYDVDLKIPNWKPNADETRLLSAAMIKLSRKRLPFERLEVDMDLALDMFQENKYKFQQIPEIAQSSSNGRSVCLYRLGDFVDISKGPMMTHSGHVSKCTIGAVHPLPQCKEISDTMYRIQGVALPDGILLNHFAYSIIEQRGKQFNSARVPGSPLAALSHGMAQSLLSGPAASLSQRSYHTMTQRLSSNLPFLHLDLSNQTRSVTKFSFGKGKRKTVKAVVRRFYRLDWGIWIHPKSGRHRRLYRKGRLRRNRVRQHVFCNATQTKMLDRMTTRYWHKKKYWVDDPYENYHTRDNFPATAGLRNQGFNHRR